MLAEELHAAMERLPAEEQELLEMYYWESMKLQEIGRSFGTTPQNIYQRLRRVRRKLRRIMQNKKS
jgi:RNA polymerase sigma factor (sigma-70 family)